jgi:hypothetical protein
MRLAGCDRRHMLGRLTAIGDHQARQLLAARAKQTLKAKRDRAMLSRHCLYHALGRETSASSRFQILTRRVASLMIDGKAKKKAGFLPLHPGDQRAHPRLPRRGRPPRRRQRRAISTD